MTLLIRCDLTSQIRYQRTFDMQVVRRKNMIRKILLKRIKRVIDVNNSSHIYNVTVVNSHLLLLFMIYMNLLYASTVFIFTFDVKFPPSWIQQKKKHQKEYSSALFYSRASFSLRRQRRKIRPRAFVKTR